jgi:hypothetical protein
MILSDSTILKHDLMRQRIILKNYKFDNDLQKSKKTII